VSPPAVVREEELRTFIIYLAKPFVSATMLIVNLSNKLTGPLELSQFQVKHSDDRKLGFSTVSRPDDTPFN
jgi:hypothetical protein